MSDGRCFTNYGPSCQTNIDMKKAMKTESNAEYREFLQNNGEQIMQQMRTICKHTDDFYCSLCKPAFSPVKES